MDALYFLRKRKVLVCELLHQWMVCRHCKLCKNCTVVLPAHQCTQLCSSFVVTFFLRNWNQRLCLRPMEHVRSTSQLLLLVMYQITAHDDSQKGTEKPTWPPLCTPAPCQCNSRMNCVAAKGVLGRLVTCSPCCPHCLPKSAEGGAVKHGVGETEVLVARQARCFRQQKVMAVWVRWQEVVPGTL